MQKLILAVDYVQILPANLPHLPRTSLDRAEAQTATR
jgi:hypothetical protein